MNLVVDANVIKFYCPDFVFEEINKHLAQISRKNSLSIEENEQFLKVLSKYVKTVEYEFYCKKLSDAEKIIGSIDEKDVPYIALA